MSYRWKRSFVWREQCWRRARIGDRVNLFYVASLWVANTANVGLMWISCSEKWCEMKLLLLISICLHQTERVLHGRNYVVTRHFIITLLIGKEDTSFSSLPFFREWLAVGSIRKASKYSPSNTNEEFRYFFRFAILEKSRLVVLQIVKWRQSWWNFWCKPKYNWIEEFKPIDHADLDINSFACIYFVSFIPPDDHEGMTLDDGHSTGINERTNERISLIWERLHEVFWWMRSVETKELEREIDEFTHQQSTSKTRVHQLPRLEFRFQ